MLGNLIELTAEQLIQRQSPVIRKELSQVFIRQKNLRHTRSRSITCSRLRCLCFAVSVWPKEEPRGTSGWGKTFIPI
jgi:hypothetical protein